MADQTYSRFDSIVEVAKLMNEKYRKRDEYAKMDIRMAAMASCLTNLEKKTKHVDDLERRLNIAENEIALLQRKPQAAEGGKKNDIPSPTARVVTSEAIEKTSEKLIQTMEQFEERVADHVRKYVSLRLDPGGQQISAPERTLDPNATLDEMNMEVSTNAEETTWASVVGRRATSRSGHAGGGRGGMNKPRPGSTPGAGSIRDGKRGGVIGGSGVVTPPKAVVSVKAAGGEKTATELLSMAKERIPVADMEVDSMRTRESASGGLVIEFSGEDGAKRADALADSLRTALGDLVVVSRSVKLAMFRLRGLDLTAGREDVKCIVASVGGCSVMDVLVGEIGRLPSGARIVWVRCPVAVARSLFAKGHLVIGWSPAIVEYFKVQRTQCYRCWSFGHVRETCKFAEDRKSGLCFRCGLPGHCVKKCTNALRCVLCHTNK